MASTLATVMVNQPVSILRREPRARILRHAHSHHRSLSAVSSALANVTPPGSPDRTCSTEEEEAHVEEVPAGLPDVASQIPGLFEESGCAVVAHRGLGMNLKPGRGIRENTVASIIAAHDFGADWSEFDVQVQIYVLLFGGWACAWTLDQWCEHDFPIVTALTLFGSWISYIYSAPPLKLKQEGWRGNYALGASYIALPWWAGQAVFGELSLDVMVMTVLYSIAGLGIAIVNDFKSIEGDRQMGLMSLPVAFGVEKAKWICVGSIDATQLAVAGYLRTIGEVGYSNALLALIFPQIFFQFKFFLPDPIKNDVKYQASAQPFLVFGLLTTGLAWGHHINAIGA